MGMDGISIANTGSIKEQTSAEYANRVEQSVASDPTNSSQQVQGLSYNQRVREKEDEENGNGQNARNQDDQNEFQDGLVESQQEEPEQNFNIEDFEDPNKEFYVKLNVKDDIIELYDRVTDRLIETISGSELGELVQKIKYGFRNFYK